MEAKEIDIAVEQLENINTTLNQSNFKLEGMQEDIERMEESLPKVYVRQIDLNKRKMRRLGKVAETLNIEKERLEAIVQSYQLDLQAKKKAEDEAKAAKKAKAAAKRKAKREAKKAQREENGNA
jgi:hypothetical protein